MAKIKIEKMDVLNLMDEELLPEINKLRLLRELTISGNVDFQGEVGESEGSVLAGLYHILRGVIDAYRKTYDEIDAMAK